LVTLGSTGDVHPMLALGTALKERGHRAVVLTNPVFEGMVLEAGLEFEAIGTERDYEQTVAHPKLWHPVDGLGVMWRYLLRPSLLPTFERLVAWSSKGPCLVLANPLAMGARVAQENLGLPLVSVYTAPTFLRTVCPPLILAKWQLPPWMPLWMLRLIWHALDLWKLQPLVMPALEGLRQTQGLAPLTSSVFGQWIHSPQAGLALFPKWFAPAAPDWPRHVVQTDFVRFENLAKPLPSGLQTFLENGDAPVVFMPGTALQDTDVFFSEALKACDALGLRAVLLGKLSNALETKVSERASSVWAGLYVPFVDLLPRARALVHQGGIGSSAQALQAGVAQLVVPRAYDQFDNAFRLQWLGVAQVLQSLTPGLMQFRLQSLLQSSDVANACMRCAKQVSPHDSLDFICDYLEQWL